jgi:hypothetical protein
MARAPSPTREAHVLPRKFTPELRELCRSSKRRATTQVADFQRELLRATRRNARSACATKARGFFAPFGCRFLFILRSLKRVCAFPLSNQFAGRYDDDFASYRFAHAASSSGKFQSRARTDSLSSAPLNGSSRTFFRNSTAKS